MKKRPKVAILNTIEDTRVNLIQDTNEWGIVKTSAGNELLLGMFRIGKLVRVESFDPEIEHRQLVTIGADVTPEVITASTRYKIEIGNPDDKYESQRKGPAIHAYTTPVTIDADTAVNRLNVYTALAAKINAYAGNNVTAYTLSIAAYTEGSSPGNASTNFIMGEVVDQETSTETARIAKCTVVTGTFYGDDAAGYVWFFDISTLASWLVTAKTLTAAGTVAGVTTNCVITVTNATTIHDAGLVLEDDAGYFTSNISRAGVNWVGATQGWIVSVAEIALAYGYAEGIGSVMAQLIPRYDQSKQSVISGFLEFELQAGDTFDIAKTYRKYVFTLKDGDENAMSAEKENSEFEIILYCDFAATHLGDLDTAISALT